MAKGQKITEEEWKEIQRLLDKGISPRRMPFTVGRCSNTIYHEIKKRGIKLSDKKMGNRPQPKFELSEDPDYSKFPDTVLFNPKHFPSF